MKLANIFHLGLKELSGLARDTTMMVLIVYSFTISVYTASQAISDTLNNAAISIVDEDRSPLSSRIGSAFYPPYFSVPKEIDIAEMDRRMNEGLDTFALDIPPEFQRDVLAGRVPSLQLNVDATRITQAYSGAGYVQNIVSGEISEFLKRYRSAPSVPVDLVLRARFNPELDKSWFGSVINVVTSITMLSIILTGAALIREREHGTIEHLLVMPVSALEIMLSKVWSMGLVVLLASAFSMALVVQGLLEVPIQGSMTLFLVATALELFATTSLGILLATVSGSMPQFGMMLMLVLLPLQVLSGGMTPRESMPEIIQYIMLAAPNTHYIILAKAVLFKGAGIDIVWPQLAILTGLGMVFFVIALRRFRVFLR